MSRGEQSQQKAEQPMGRDEGPECVLSEPGEDGHRASKTTETKLYALLLVPVLK